MDSDFDPSIDKSLSARLFDGLAAAEPPAPTITALYRDFFKRLKIDDRPALLPDPNYAALAALCLGQFGIYHSLTPEGRDAFDTLMRILRDRISRESADANSRIKTKRLVTLLSQYA